MPLQIMQLQQALCADRRQIVFGPDPGDWIRRSLPLGWRLFSFHFFVNWSAQSLSVGNRVWLTRLIKFEDPEEAEATDYPQLEMALRTSDVLKEFYELQRTLNKYGIQTEIILLPEIPCAKVNDHTSVWTGRISGVNEFVLNKLKLSELRTAIQQESGGPIRIGNKGLTYGTSTIECYLSGTDSPYPGDVDCILVDNNDVVRCLIEYKKHTLNDAIGKHLINRYYPNPDGRKYLRLDALVRRFQERKSPVPFVMLYYSSKKSEARLQVVGELRAEKATILQDSGELTFYDHDPARVVGDLIMKWLGCGT
jgi:hypothetical protein